MGSVRALVDIYNRLNESNRFAVLVYARLKVVRQMAGHCKPYARERRAQRQKRFAHWAGLGA